MKTTYKGCEIEVTKERCLGGWNMLFYSVFDDGLEITSGFSESSDTVKDFIKGLKNIVDNYRENPEEYLDT
jgi:hypothetical protein